LILLTGEHYLGVLGREFVVKGRHAICMQGGKHQGKTVQTGLKENPAQTDSQPKAGPLLAEKLTTPAFENI
jgi:hypothetical protein